jgi:hypothetical protein
MAPVCEYKGQHRLLRKGFQRDLLTERFQQNMSKISDLAKQHNVMAVFMSQIVNEVIAPANTPDAKSWKK